MKKIIYPIFVIFIFSCSKNDEIEDSSETRLISSGTKLISIEYSDENDSWVETYSYSANSELNQIEDFRSLGRRYEIEYKNNRLKQYTTFRMDEDKLIFRDSILYNNDGTIKTIYNFSINSGENLPLSRIYEFEYDNENKVSKKSTYSVRNQEYTSIEKYFWKGNNIERVEHHNGNEELYYEYFYEYDDKINYKKELPTGISDPINWSNNNVVKMNWNDYFGNLDLICRPCLAEYQYNLDNYPVSIQLNWGRELKLKYE